MLLIKKNELINSKFELIKIVNNILMKNKNNKYQIDNEESVNNKDIQQMCIKRKKEFNSSEENSSESEDFLIKKNLNKEIYKKIEKY